MSLSFLSFVGGGGEYFVRKKIFLHSNASTGLIILHKIRYNV